MTGLLRLCNVARPTTRDLEFRAPGCEVG